MKTYEFNPEGKELRDLFEVSRERGDQISSLIEEAFRGRNNGDAIRYLNERLSNSEFVLAMLFSGMKIGQDFALKGIFLDGLAPNPVGTRL